MNKICLYYYKIRSKNVDKISSTRDNVRYPAPKHSFTLE